MKIISGSWHPPAKNIPGEDLHKLAMLGGYLARAIDAPPGNLIIWRACPDL
ncbi:MAG: Transposase Tn5 dimerization domain [Chthoniobacteraceae bacterium]|nr:Transposase Tn5 dimerization domain [Chthoniobacteraceae bacterium]